MRARCRRRGSSSRACSPRGRAARAPRARWRRDDPARRRKCPTASPGLQMHRPRRRRRCWRRWRRRRRRPSTLQARRASRGSTWPPCARGPPRAWRRRAPPWCPAATRPPRRGTDAHPRNVRPQLSSAANSAQLECAAPSWRPQIKPSAAMRSFKPAATNAYKKCATNVQRRLHNESYSFGTSTGRSEGKDDLLCVATRIKRGCKRLSAKAIARNSTKLN
mmetsp:Transcript_59591/g.129203  ORF Transcript_59591/g.129203 Transcript_59591/m.129203 type:complete len:220 (+) Transcript_59591:1298-1957(+)